MTTRIDPPPSDLSDESEVRAWFRSLPTPVCLLIAGEVEWIAWGHVDTTRRFVEWFRGDLAYSEFVKGTSPFGMTSFQRRRTARKLVGLDTCVAHAERGSRNAVADECARLPGHLLTSSWLLADLLHWYADFPPRAVEFAHAVDGSADRAVLCDLLNEHGWTPFNEDIAAIFAGTA